RNAASAEAGTRQIKGWRKQGARIGALTQIELTRRPEHASHGRDAVRQIQEERLFGQFCGRRGRWHVAVHLCKSRNQKLAASVDSPRTRRNFYLSVRTHRNDAITSNNDGVIRQR